ncbi:MAG: hypothetical protein ACJAX8_000755, partial [Flavobacteriales bacterium]
PRHPSSDSKLNNTPLQITKNHSQNTRNFVAATAHFVAVIPSPHFLGF